MEQFQEESIASDANQSFATKKKKLLKSTDYFYRVVMRSSKAKKRRRNSLVDKTPKAAEPGTMTNQISNGLLTNKSNGETKMSGILAAFKRALKKDSSEPSKENSVLEESKPSVIS